MRNAKTLGLYIHTKALQNKNGITLIALVVTIVVLLILAGVSLNLVLENNGIIAKSKDARDRTKLAAYTEEINLIASAEETSYKLEEISYGQMVQNVKSNIESKKYVEQVNQKSVSIGTTLEATTDLGIITVILSKDGVTVSEGEVELPEVADASIFNYAVTDDGNIEIKGFNLDNLDYEDISNCSEIYYYWRTIKINNMQTLKIPETIGGKDVVKVAFSYNIYNGEEIRGAEDDYRYMIDGKRYGWPHYLAICGIQTIIYPSSVKEIDTAFDCFIDTEQVSLNSGLETIGSEAFSLMENLKTISIPNSVMNIGGHAFLECNKLLTINCEATSQPSEWDTNWNLGCSATVNWGYTGE